MCVDNEYQLVLEFYYWQSPMVQIYEAVEDAQFRKQLLAVAAFRRIDKNDNHNCISYAYRKDNINIYIFTTDIARILTSFPVVEL